MGTDLINSDEEVKAQSLENAALIIIDMQGYFLSSIPEDCRKIQVENIIKTIEKAKKYNMEIIVVRFLIESLDGQHVLTSDLIAPLVTALRGYEHYTFVDKKNNSAWSEIKKYLEKNERNFESFVVCGVNTGFCVKQTVCDAADDNRNVIVLKDCCQQELRTHYFKSDEEKQEARQRALTVHQNALKEMALKDTVSCISHEKFFD